MMTVDLSFEGQVGINLLKREAFVPIGQHVQSMNAWNYLACSE